MKSSVSVQEADFDLSAEVRALTAGEHSAGAVASFVGLVRDNNDGTGVADMTLEHYPGMTEKALGEIVVKAGERWELLGVRVIHRVGHLMPGDQIVLVVVSSPHRGECLRRLRVHHGLSQDPGTVLEEGKHGRRQPLGGCARE